MAKKAEFESARLSDFEFRRRARATRLLAVAFGLDEDALVASIARLDEEALIASVATHARADLAEVATAYAQCLSGAHRQLVGERGDPTPHRLA